MQENLSFESFIQECLQELMRGSIDDSDNPLQSLIIQTQYALSQASFLDLGKKEILNNLSLSLKNPMRVAIIGQFSSGKSTFLNALLGDEILPSGITPVTAKVCEIVYGENLALEVLYKNGEVIKKELTFLELVDEMENLKISHYKLYAPLPLLKEVSFLDTPGFNSQNESDTETTNAILESVDGIIWLTLIDNVGKNSEKQILQTHISRYANKSICVLNQKDRLKNQGEIDTSIEYAKSAFSGFFEQTLAISAKMALDSIKRGDESLYRESGIKEVLDYINDSIYKRASSAKEFRVKQSLRKLLVCEKKALHDRAMKCRQLDGILKIFPQELKFNMLQSGLEDSFKKLFVALEIKFDALSQHIFNAFELKKIEIVKESKNRFGFKSTIVQSKDINVLPKERLASQLCSEDSDFAMEFKKLGFSMHEFGENLSAFIKEQGQGLYHRIESFCTTSELSFERIYKEIYSDYDKALLINSADAKSELHFLQLSLSNNLTNAIVLCLERLNFEVENALAKHRGNQDLPLYNPTLENTRNLINQGLHYGMYQDRLSLGFSIYKRTLWNLSESLNKLYADKSAVIKTWLDECSSKIAILDKTKESVIDFGC